MSAKFFGQFLLERGAISGEQLVEAVRMQTDTNARLGRIAIQRKLLTSGQVRTISKLQRTVDQRFGEIAVAQGLLNHDQRQALLAAQHSERLMLGDALVLIKALTKEQLAEHLRAFRADQSKVPVELSVVYGTFPLSGELEICTDTTAKIFLRLAHLLVKVNGAEQGPPEEVYDYYLHQKLTGDFAATVVIGLSEDVVRVVARELLEQPFDVLGEHQFDAATEFLNIIAGNIAGKLSRRGKRCELQPPQLHSVAHHGKFDWARLAGRVFNTSLALPEHSIALCVVVAGSD